MTHAINATAATNVAAVQKSRLRSMIVRSAIVFSLVLSASVMATQNSFADARDVNRTGGETVDTVMWPQPPAKTAPKTDTSKDTDTTNDSDTGDLRCGVVFTILVCF
jgi:hypothetical protein